MKTLLLSLSAFLLILTGCDFLSDNSETTTGTSEQVKSVENRSFVGKPTSNESKNVPGCEGCGNSGGFYFGDKTVDFLYPGSDIMNRASFAQNASSILLSYDGMEDTLLVIDDITIEDKFGTIYRDEDHPW